MEINNSFDIENEPYRIVYRCNSLPERTIREVPPSNYVPQHDGPPRWVFIGIILAGIGMGLITGEWADGGMFVIFSFMGLFWVCAMEATLSR
jgi:hypothetical protein